MPKLYGSMQGNKGTVTRTGSTEISAHIRTASVGLETVILARRDGTFLLRVYITGGSDAVGAPVLISEYQSDADGTAGHVRGGWERGPNATPCIK